MRTSSVNEMVTRTTYICDVCSAKSPERGVIEKCEARHACAHPNRETSFEDNYGGTEIYQTCSDCHCFVGPIIVVKELSWESKNCIYDAALRIANKEGKCLPATHSS